MYIELYISAITNSTGDFGIERATLDESMCYCFIFA
jgi:hypothetical protein